MRFGSLFTGIGGFDLGLERAGMRPAWQCEQDEFCQHVLAKHWPDVPCYPDVEELRGADVEPVDVLAGGSPCQGLSDAGHRLGLDDPRSRLWSEFARLVGELRPRYVVLENVAALLGRGFGRVLGDLAALGYDAEWDCLPATAFGAPHLRDRVWLVAYPDTQRRDGRPGQLRPRRRAEPADGGPQLGGSWPAEPRVGRVAYGVPDRVDRVAALGNALVPQIAEWIGRRIIEWEASSMKEAA